MENNNDTIQECIHILKDNKENDKVNNIQTLKKTIETHGDDLKKAIQNDIKENFCTNYLHNNININNARIISNNLSLVSTPTIIASLVLGSSHLCCIGGIGLLTSLCMDDGIDLYTSWHNRNTANSLESVQQWIKANNEISIKEQSNQPAQNDNSMIISKEKTINEAIKHLQQIMQINYNDYYQKTIANNLVEGLFKVINSQLGKAK